MLWVEGEELVDTITFGKLYLKKKNDSMSCDLKILIFSKLRFSEPTQYSFCYLGLIPSILFIMC